MAHELNGAGATRLARQHVFFQRVAAARGFASLWMIVAVVFLAQLVHPDSVPGHVFTAALFALAIVAVVRAWRMSAVDADLARIRIRRFDRTVTYPWSTIEVVEAVAHVNGFRGAGLTLGITSAGRTRKFREFYYPVSAHGTTPIQVLVQELKELQQDAAHRDPG